MLAKLKCPHPGDRDSGRGRVPENAIDRARREEVVRLYEEKYKDLNDTHFTEKLNENVFRPIDLTCRHQ